MNLLHGLLCIAVSTLVYMSTIFISPTIPKSNPAPIIMHSQFLKSYQEELLGTSDSATANETTPEKPALEVEKKQLKGALTYDNKEVVRYNIEYPFFVSGIPGYCREKLNKYYEKKAQDYLQYIQNSLYENLIQIYEEQVKLNQKTPVYEAYSTYKITNSQDNILSLYTDVYEYTGGAHGNTKRDSQTWNLNSCKPLTLEDLYKEIPNYKQLLFAHIEKEMNKNRENYFLEEGLAQQTFRPENFYLKEDHIIVYYQEYDLAPYVAGIVEFTFQKPKPQEKKTP